MGWSNHKSYLNDRRSLWTNFSRGHLSQLLQDGRTLSVTRLCNAVITTPPDADAVEYELLDKDETFALLKKLNTPSRTIDFLAGLKPLPPAFDGEW